MVIDFRACAGSALTIPHSLVLADRQLRRIQRRRRRIIPTLLHRLLAHSNRRASLRIDVRGLYKLGGGGAARRGLVGGDVLAATVLHDPVIGLLGGCKLQVLNCQLLLLTQQPELLPVLSWNQLSHIGLLKLLCIAA